MGTRRGIVAITIALAACAPSVDGPIERQRAADREDADRLALQLLSLPGTITASVTLHRTAADPLGTGPASRASGVALIVVDDAVDRAEVSATASALFAASAPEIPDRVVSVVVGAHRPALASVGPFTVEEGSRGPLRATLALALGAIAVLAAWIAYRERRRG